MNIRDIHSYLAVVNAKNCEVRVLDSISDRFGCQQLELMVSVMLILSIKLKAFFIMILTCECGHIYCINSSMGCRNTLTLYCVVSILMIRKLSGQTSRLLPGAERKYVAAGTHRKMGTCLTSLLISMY
jgi:hypothetical protein